MKDKTIMKAQIQMAKMLWASNDLDRVAFGSAVCAVACGSVGFPIPFVVSV